MTIQELQEQYQEDIKLEEASIEKRMINIPIILSKYQNYYFDTLNKISELYDIQEQTYHNLLLDYKSGESDLANYSLSNTEVKRMLESSLVYRDVSYRIARLENELKLVEEMMSNIKQISWSIKNYVDYIKLKEGIV